MRAYPLFTLFGLRTAVTPVAVGAFALVAAALAWLATSQGGLSFAAGWAAGLVCVGVMFVSEWLHQAGHGLAARRTGYPMTGMTFFSVLARSEYPADEPRLPARLHIRRALGGFWVNLLVGAILAGVWWSGADLGPVGQWGVGFGAVYNFFVLGLGALIPLDIPQVLTTDGGTIWKYWRQGN